MIIGIGLTLRATLLGSTAVSDPYEVAGFSPSLVFDFAEEFYRTGGSTTTFEAAMTHSRSGNATMVDSDGLLKWAPHNLLTWSGDPSTTFSINNDSVWTDANTLFATAQAGIQAPYGREVFTFPSAGTYSFEFEVTDANVQYVTINFQSFDAGTNGLDVFDVQSGSVATESANHTASISATTDGYLCKVVVTLDGSDLSGSFDLGISEEAALNRIADPDGTEYAVFRRLRIYRSDLGGMVDNPDTGNSYVPTTSAARYLPRRRHHIYNGSAWVNAWYLHESEARTNLLLNSGTLATQNVTVTAVPHTLHFTGTGTVTLSGASTAGPLVGTGTGENNRVSLTFTPTAGTLTVTVTGTVTNADLEVGSTLSSHKPTSGSTVTRSADTITVPYANLPYDATAMSIQMDGKMTYADEGGTEVIWFDWRLNSSNYVQANLRTQAAATGEVYQLQAANGVGDDVDGRSSQYSPGINVPFNIASRHGSTFINGAVDGVALTADLTPTALPALSAANLQLGFNYMGTIKKFRMWSDDLGDTGIEEATA